jgi:DNA replicative helicase MCM subunit Mcm2 (Cdc46/Mcm family)/DNA-binding CsgD family transcriptional regulator
MTSEPISTPTPSQTHVLPLGPDIEELGLDLTDMRLEVSEATPSDASSNDVIALQLTEELEVSNIFSSYPSKSLIVISKNKNKPINLPILLDDWDSTHKGFYNILVKNGITEEHSRKIQTFCSSQHQVIVDHFAQQTLANMNAGQRKKKERIEKLKHSPPIELSIKDALRMHEGNIRVRGMINGLGTVEKMYKAAGFTCGECDEINPKWNYTNSRPRFADEIPRIRLDEVKCVQGCESFRHELWSDPINALKIVLSDTEVYSELESLSVILLDNYTRNVQTGEQVIIAGSLQMITLKGKTLPYLFVGLNPIDGVNPFEYVNKKESIELSETDEKEVQDFLKKHKGKELDELAKLVAPSIIGYEHVKKGFLMSLVNSGKDPVWKKRRLHSLLIGDPGLAKSYLIYYMVRLAGGNSTFTSAADASTKSLIGVVDNDEKILRIGPIPRAHGRICSIDEIGRMSPQDQGYILSAMQQGVIYFARYGFNTPLPASTTFILSCNPAGNSGKLKERQEKIKIYGYEYPIIGPLRDRIDFFFIFQTKRNIPDAMNYAFEKIRIDDNYDEVLKKEEENIRFLQKLDVLSHKLDPTFSVEARHVIMQFYVKAFSSADSKHSPRLLDTLNNACYAVARLKLKDVVEVDDAKEVIKFFKEQIEQHQSQIDIIPYDPRDLAVEEIIKQLTDSKFKHQWTELLDAVCKKDDDNGKWVSGYVKDDGPIRNKKKSRNIRTRLKEYASAHKDKILILLMSPLTLAWRETYTGGDKDAAIDIDRVVDPEDMEEEERPSTPTLTLTPTPLTTPGSGATNSNSPDNRQDENEGTLGTQGTLPSASAALTSDMTLEQRRVRVKELIGEGHSRRKVAQILDIDERTVRRDLEGAALTSDMSDQSAQSAIDGEPLQNGDETKQGPELVSTAVYTAVHNNIMSSYGHLGHLGHLGVTPTSDVTADAVPARPTPVEIKRPENMPPSPPLEHPTAIATNIVAIEKHGEQGLTNEQHKIDNNNGSEDYVARQKKVFDAIVIDQNLSSEQKARRIFDELENAVRKSDPISDGAVLESRFKDALMSSGLCETSDDASITIANMNTKLEQVFIEVEGGEIISAYRRSGP